MKDFVQQLKNNLARDLDKATIESENTGQKYGTSLRLVNKALLELRIFMTTYKFQNQQEEIYYYKEAIPALYAEYLYYGRLLDIETKMPAADKKMYYKSQVKELRRFFRKNNAFYQYCKLNVTELDYSFYSKEAMQTELAFEEYCPLIDMHFITVKGFKLAQCIAYERLLNYLTEQLRVPSSEAKATATRTSLKWTESKISLVELLYALFYSGCFNQGKAGIKEVAQTFEQVFQVSLGNFYRSKQELYIRKSSVVFLDMLKVSLQRGLDESDNN